MATLEAMEVAMGSKYEELGRCDEGRRWEVDDDDNEDDVDMESCCC